MIDRIARDRAIELLEGFCSGALTNIEIDRMWPEATADTGLAEIGAVLGGTFFLDIRSYKMTDEGHGSEDALHLIERCIMFLATDRVVGKPFRPARGPLLRHAIAGTIGLPLAWWYAWGLDYVWVSAAIVGIGWLILAPAIVREFVEFRDAKARYDEEFELWLTERKVDEEEAEADWWPFHDQADYEATRKQLSK